MLIVVLFTHRARTCSRSAAAALRRRAVLRALQHRRVRAWWLYVPLGAAGLGAGARGRASTRRSPVWCSGCSPGSAPTRARHEAPAVRLEHRLQPWSAGAVRAGVRAVRGRRADRRRGAARGVHPAGGTRCAGRPAGRQGGRHLRLLLARPSGSAPPAGRPAWAGGTWPRCRCSAASGSPVSLLIAELALADQGPQLDTVKAAVLLASADGEPVGAPPCCSGGAGRTPRGRPPSSRPRVVAQPCRARNPYPARAGATVEGWPGRRPGRGR